MSGGWNYRVIRRRVGRRAYTYSIYEAYYDDQGRIHSWSASPDYPQGDSFASLRREFTAYMQAFQKPVLDEWKLPEKGARGFVIGKEKRREKGG